PSVHPARPVPPRWLPGATACARQRAGRGDPLLAKAEQRTAADASSHALSACSRCQGETGQRTTHIALRLPLPVPYPGPERLSVQSVGTCSPPSGRGLTEALLVLRLTRRSRTIMMGCGDMTWQGWAGAQGHLQQFLSQAVGRRNATMDLQTIAALAGVVS